jgi:hypothetical protein
MSNEFQFFNNQFFTISATFCLLIEQALGEIQTLINIFLFLLLCIRLFSKNIT